MAEQAQKTSGGGFIRHTRNLSVSVLLSRILGLLRDMIMSAVLGGGVLMSAWVQASTFANIFRQVLGEGALGQALVPILAQTMKERGPEAARKLFTTLFIYLTMFLTILTVLISVPVFLLADWFTSPIWNMTARLMPIVMPYAVFICAVGVMTSYMNMLREFFLPSLTAIIQNLVIIGAMLFVCPFFAPGWNTVRAIAFSVLAAGVIELLFMLWLLRRSNMQMIFSRDVWLDYAGLREIFTVALPGIIAASAHILSTLADRLLSGNIPKFAGEIGNYATSSLYYTDRLVLLPIGIFAFAFGTVALTEMSRSHADGDRAAFLSTLDFSLKTLLFITVPMTAFLFLFGEPVLKLLFMRGEFDTTALEQTVFALRFYVFGIPAFAALKITVTAFTSRKDMKTPFYTGITAILINFILNVILMFPLRQGGIALATVVSSYINNLLLLCLLRRQLGESLPARAFLVFLLKLAAVSVLPLAAAYPAFAGMRMLDGNLPVPGACPPIAHALRFLYGCIPLGTAAILYGGLLFVCARFAGMSEAHAVLAMVRRRGKTKKPEPIKEN